jgi:hypothetical protein
VLFQPGARLFHRVAILDPVDRDGFGHARSSAGRYVSQAAPGWQFAQLICLPIGAAFVSVMGSRSGQG